MKKLFTPLLLITCFLCLAISGCDNKSTTDVKVNKDSVEKETTRRREIQTQESQSNLTPAAVVQNFKNGNKRFVDKTGIHDDLLEEIYTTGTQGQFPQAVILGCMDSRAPVELIFDKGIGDAFITRVAGNYADDGVIGGMEYATKVVNAKVIMVLGHSDCGAIKGACDHVELGNLTYVINQIQPAIDMVADIKEDRNSKNKKFVDEVTKQNVLYTMKKIREKSEIIRNLEAEGKVTITGAVYDVTTGAVNFVE